MVKEMKDEEKQRISTADRLMKTGSTYLPSYPLGGKRRIPRYPVPKPNQFGLSAHDMCSHCVIILDELDRHIKASPHPYITDLSKDIVANASINIKKARRIHYRYFYRYLIKKNKAQFPRLRESEIHPIILKDLERRDESTKLN